MDWRWLLALSLLLSLWLVAIDPVINRDAILYLRAAEAYLDQGLLASQALHGRPVLSICIAWLHQLTGLPLLYCGLLLNAAFYAVLVLAFVATVATLGGDRRTQLFAAALILSHPIINEYRSSIMRDPAYWEYKNDAPLWGGVMTTAGGLVFTGTPEGLFIALALPLVLMAVSPHPRRLQHGIALLVPVLIVTALAGLLLSQGGRDGQALFPAIDHYLGQLRALETDLTAIRPGRPCWYLPPGRTQALPSLQGSLLFYC